MWPPTGVDETRECVFGSDLTVDDIIWTGPQQTLKEKCLKTGILETAPSDKLQEVLAKAERQGRKIHFLPQYRTENILKIERLLPPVSAFSESTGAMAIQQHSSETLVKAVVSQRSIKNKEEVEQIETAIDISYEMQMLAMKMSKPGVHEREVAGTMEAIALSQGSGLAFPTIFSINGQTLHNHNYINIMKQGDIAINDSGAESALHYASDITRTIPVGGRFSKRQREIYAIVLNAQEKAIDAVKPGVEFRAIHRLACKILASGLKDLGLMKGDIDEAVDAGAHTLFFPCGLGHMLGLDVHDMEALGENYVGYNDEVRRSDKFGLAFLRFALPYQPGHVFTIEPGCYFIPELIGQWKSEGKFRDFINYDRISKYMPIGGVRIEDNVLITEKGHKVLGKPIPKTVKEIETICS